MPQRHRGTAPLAAILAACTVVATAAAAWADQSSPLAGAGLVAVRSTGGNVTIAVGNPGEVRIVGPQGVIVRHFAVSADADGHIMLPQQGPGLGGAASPAPAGNMLNPPPPAGSAANNNGPNNGPNTGGANPGPGRGGFGPRSFTIPGLQDGSDGLSIINRSGGDMTIYVPPMLAGLIIGAGPGNVSASNLSGSYVIVTGRGGVNLQNVSGRGLVRTWTGPITLNNVAGALGVESARGTVTAREMSVTQADVRTQSGNVDWEFSMLGRGAYRFNSRAGNIQVGLAPDAAANVDAQSESGSVVNAFGRRRGNVHIFNRHALSMSLRGGGPEITASSRFGRVTIRPHKPF
jgi:hypothetical protein